MQLVELNAGVLDALLIGAFSIIKIGTSGVTATAVVSCRTRQWDGCGKADEFCDECGA